MKGPDMADIKPLLHTQKARERIMVAISWDERSDKITIMDKVRGTNQQHDLDLACFVFDADGNYIDFVGSMAQDAMDSTGCIYHSGDDSTGEGLGDDESLSIELAGLPRTTAQLVFVTEIQSDHVFSQVNLPTMRVADGANDKNLATLDMTAAQGADAKACVMARIFRDRTSETGWSLHLIGDYPDLSQVSDWGSYLPRYFRV